ncbi:hypothetical protein HDU97_004769 [Phlyctochytrium planicorne]|nr:hypothetical protein HDU97_004769 [Phlyctochytrium planicorne]
MGSAKPCVVASSIAANFKHGRQSPSVSTATPPNPHASEQLADVIVKVLMRLIAVRLINDADAAASDMGLIVPETPASKARRTAKQGKSMLSRIDNGSLTDNYSREEKRHRQLSLEEDWERVRGFLRQLETPPGSPYSVQSDTRKRKRVLEQETPSPSYPSELSQVSSAQSVEESVGESHGILHKHVNKSSLRTALDISSLVAETVAELAEQCDTHSMISTSSAPLPPMPIHSFVGGNAGTMHRTIIKQFLRRQWFPHLTRLRHLAIRLSQPQSTTTCSAHFSTSLYPEPSGGSNGGNGGGSPPAHSTPHGILHALLIARRILSSPYPLPPTLLHDPCNLLVASSMLAEVHLSDRQTSTLVWAGILDSLNNTPNHNSTPKPPQSTPAAETPIISTAQSKQVVMIQPFEFPAFQGRKTGATQVTGADPERRKQVAKMKTDALHALGFDTFISVAEYATWLKVLKVVMLQSVTRKTG